MSDRLLALVKNFANEYEPSNAPITLETTVIDLNFDSLDTLELVMFIEDELGIEVADEEVENFVKIGDLLKSPTIARALNVK